ncbi:unnamed protein product [Rangifer tarandus platyrhynchus]|uniref:Uncharacterized protein n=2 Tax=Rangifer tarandus platyrhynchus TaxID=3082113 RepID=A0ABN8XZK9_RANTA|nr:unnamed protein product [Rangifer tarandus platyrhynchus]
MGKGLETAVVKTVGPKEVAAAGAGRLTATPAPLGNRRPMPEAPECWFWWGSFVCLFWVFFIFFLPCERSSRRHRPFSDWLTQNTWGNPGHRAARPPPAPGLGAPEKITHASCRAGAELLSALRPTPPAVPTHHCSLPEERCILSFISFF